MTTSIRTAADGLSSIVSINGVDKLTIDSAGKVTAAKFAGIVEGGISSGTAINTTSGTAHDFTGIPNWVKKITLSFKDVSTNGTSPVQIQIGSGSVTTTGYVTCASLLAAGVVTANYSSGLVSNLESSGASISARVGHVIFTNVSGNVWSGSCILVAGTQPYTNLSATAVTLAGSLDRIRVTTINGTDAFDNGSINILYE